MDWRERGTPRVRPTQPWRYLCVLLLALSAIGWATNSHSQPRVESPIRVQHMDQIRSLFARYALPRAQVAIDHYGRAVLKGDFENQEEVEIGHSIIQSVVGVKWTSFVTPENVRVTRLQRGAESALKDLFGRVRPQAPAQASPSTPLTSSDGPPGPVQSRYALVMGVGQFMQRGIRPLEFAGSDAQEFHSYLTGPGGPGFRATDVLLLVDQQAVSSRVLAWLDEVEARAQADDLVVIYASTHGSSPDSEGLMAIVTHDTVVDRPTGAQLRRSSLPGARLARFVQNVKAKRLVVILDTCYSSAAFSDVPGYAAGRGLVSNETYAFHREAVVRMTGGKDLVRDDALLAPSGALDARADGWGQVLITASGADQRSWESQQLRASFFTHYFLKGLRSTRNLRDAFAYSRQIVPGEVMLEKRAVQTPAAFSTNPNWAMSF